MGDGNRDTETDVLATARETTHERSGPTKQFKHVTELNKQILKSSYTRASCEAETDNRQTRTRRGGGKEKDSKRGREAERENLTETAKEMETGNVPATETASAHC